MGRALRSLLVVMWIGVTATPPVASAAPPELSRAEREKARSLADEGLTLFEQGSYQDALDRFQSAEDIVHAPTHLLFIARAQQQVGRLLDARDTYQRIVDEKLAAKAPNAFVKAQQAASSELQALEAAIPRLAITVAGPPPEQTRVSLDGREVTALELPLDPGTYQLSAEADGYLPRDETVTLRAGDGVTPVTLSLSAMTPAEQPEADDVPLAPPILMAGGAALLVVGAVTGGLELKQACPANPCPTRFESLKRDANTLATVSTATLTVGGAAVLAGGGWLLWSLFGQSGEPASSDEPRAEVFVHPVVGPTFLGLRGSF
jgi:hypothetical protein